MMTASPMIAKVVDGVALLPCPRCAGEPQLGFGPFVVAVICKRCGATTEEEGGTKEEAAALWNHRQP